MKKLFTVLTVFTLFFMVSHALGQEKALDKPPYYLSDMELDQKLGIVGAAEAPNEYVWIVYFHRIPG